MQTPLQKLQKLLQQLFRADDADLDFGIYRILNYRRDQIQKFIDVELPSIIDDALDENTEIESALEELKELEKRVKEAFGDDVLDADGKLIDVTIKTRPLVNQYLEAQERYGSPQSRDQREDTVYNHLYTFFSRYYDNGDFIPRRRYSQTERYAIPYNTMAKRSTSTGQIETSIMSRVASIFPFISSNPKASPSPSSSAA